MLEKLWQKSPKEIKIDFFKKKNEENTALTKAQMCCSMVSVITSVSAMFLKIFTISALISIILGFSHVMDFSEQLMKINDKNFSTALLLGGGIYLFYYMLAGIFSKGEQRASKQWQAKFDRISAPIKIILLQALFLPNMPNSQSIFSECLKHMVLFFSLWIK